MEKYNNSECSSLVTYVAHVSSLLYITLLIHYIQLDLKELPTVIVNRVLRRQPMAIKYIRQKLTKPKIGLSYMFNSSPSASPRFVPRESNASTDNRFYEEYTSMSEFGLPRDIDLTARDTTDNKKNSSKKVTIDMSSSFSSQESHSINRPRAYTNSLPDLQYRGVSPLSIMSEPVPTIDHSSSLRISASDLETAPAIDTVAPRWTNGGMTVTAVVEPTN